MRNRPVARQSRSATNVRSLIRGPSLTATGAPEPTGMAACREAGNGVGAPGSFVRNKSPLGADSPGAANYRAAGFAASVTRFPIPRPLEPQYSRKPWNSRKLANLDISRPRRRACFDPPHDQIRARKDVTLAPRRGCSGAGLLLASGGAALSTPRASPKSRTPLPWSIPLLTAMTWERVRRDAALSADLVALPSTHA